MALEDIFTPIFTDAGRAAVAAAHGAGLEARISQIALGDAQYDVRDGNGDPLAAALAKTVLDNELLRVDVTAGAAVNDYEVLVEALIAAGTPEFWIGEIGFFLDDGTLLAVSSHASQYIGWRGAVSDWTFRFVLAWSDLPASAITVTFNGDAAHAALSLDHERLENKLRHTVAASGQTWSDTDDSQLTAAVPVIRNTNITYTIGSTGDYPTVYAALQALENTVLLDSRDNTITLQLLPETIQEIAYINFSAMHRGRVIIMGTMGNTGSGTTYQINGVHAISGSAGDWAVTYNLSTTTDIAVGDYLWVSTDPPGKRWYDSGAAHYMPHVNSFEITAVDSANSRVTVKNTNRQSTWHASIIAPPSGSGAHVLKTIWRFPSNLGRPGVLLEGHRRPIVIGSLVLTSGSSNTSRPVIGIRDLTFDASQYQTDGNYLLHTVHITAPSSGGLGLYMRNADMNNPVLSIGDCGSYGAYLESAALYGVRIHGCGVAGVYARGSYFGGSTTGCGGMGASLQRVSSGVVTTGFNEDWGCKAIHNSFASILTSDGNVSGGLYCGFGSNGNYNGPGGGSWINDGTSPAVNTVGNHNSYIANVVD